MLMLVEPFPTKVTLILEANMHSLWKLCPWACVMDTKKWSGQASWKKIDNVILWELFFSNFGFDYTVNTHIDISSNRKYQPFPLLSYFSVVVCLRCLLHHILSCIAYTFRENWDFVLNIIVQFMMNANSRIRNGLQIVFVCLYITPSHYHHYANLFVDIELMKCLPDVFCGLCE